MTNQGNANDWDRRDSFWMKVIRAEEHLASITAEVDFYREGDPCRLIGKFNDDQTEYVMRIEDRFMPSGRLTALVGDCLFNLRAALDHLAYELVSRALPDQMDDDDFVKLIQFPIFDSDKNRHGKPVDVGRSIPGITDQALAAIKLIQPYTKGDASLWHPLSVIQRLNNRDKHRKLLFMATGVMGGMVGINFNGWNIRRSIVPGMFPTGAEIVRWDLTPAELQAAGCTSIDELEVEGLANLVVTFDEPDPPLSRPVEGVLRECLDAVNGIVGFVCREAGLLDTLPPSYPGPASEEDPPLDRHTG